MNDSDKLNLHKEYINSVKTLLSQHDDPRMKALFEDIVGQISEAVSKTEWFDKWGRHYLPALALAHQQQICNNFKDPGLQDYGGILCNKEKELAEKVFTEMPPPTPSMNHSFYRAALSKPIPVVNMSAYMHRGGGCFHGGSPILTLDETGVKYFKEIRNLKKDDMVLSGNKFYSIRCIVKIKNMNDSDTRDMIYMGSNNLLCITPYHPVKYRSNWVFPKNIAKPNPVIRSLYVYNILLNYGSYVTIDSVDCCTLGHGISENNVINHEYYGDKAKIVADLETKEGWDEGIIELEHGCEIRDNNTGNVIGLK